MTTEESLNCTVVTALYDINREHWFDYKRSWEEYLDYFKNTLSLRAKFVIYVDSNTYDFVFKERAKIDPGMNYTKIIQKEFNQLPKFYLKERIDKVMSSAEYKKGLLDPNPPEYNNSNYSLLILSKMFLVEDAIDKNFYNTEYYMWLDAGIRHSSFRPEDNFKLYPNPLKVNDINGIRILCRFRPEESDLDIKSFYKSHKNRFGAAVIVGKKEYIKEFNIKVNDILEEALLNNLIDSEQSLHAICYLRNKDMFELIYNKDWYYHFDYYL
jgi:protein YibB